VLRRRGIQWGKDGIAWKEWFWAMRSARPDRLTTKLTRDFGDGLRRDRPALFGAPVDERVFAEKIDEARDAARVVIDGVEGLGGEDVGGIRSAASKAQALGDVLMRLVNSQG
jgi:hypothetical protein